jgi:hypothetical protein
MNERQERHLQTIKSEFEILVDQKYRSGAAEHGGELLDADFDVVLDYAIAEAVDQVTYLLTLKSKRKAAK